MNHAVSQFQYALAQKKALKVIAGIANHDVHQVLTVIEAANQTDAQAIDVSAQKDVVIAARQATSKMLFASSIVVSELVQAVKLDVDAVELGNFDALYAQGVFISAEEVLQLSQDLMAQLGGQTFVCVTIPGHLSTETQVRLAQQLEALGVNLIQTEGAIRQMASEPKTAAISADAKFERTLVNTQAITSAVSIPVMSATGVNSSNTNQAQPFGASAVGIGSAVNKLSSQDEMVAEIQASLEKLNTPVKQTVVA
jgi:hypothetical protein